MRLGLTDEDMASIQKVLGRFDEIVKARVFGSRAKGNFKAGSDVDLALEGEQVSFDTVSKVHAMLESESPMPYLFDVLDYTHLKDPDVRDHIDRVGVVIYERRKS